MRIWHKSLVVENIILYVIITGPKQRCIFKNDKNTKDQREGYKFKSQGCQRRILKQDVYVCISSYSHCMQLWIKAAVCVFLINVMRRW